MTVILGHTVSFPLFRGFIFSFHMPLFFIIGGINYHFSETKEELFRNINKSFKRLIVPSVSMYAVITIIYFIFEKTELNTHDFLLAVFFSSGVKFDSCFGPVPAVGAIWFLVCLFWCRTISDLLHYRLGNGGYGLSVAVLSCVGVSIGRLIWLPQNLDVALAVLVFFSLGIWIDKGEIIEKVSIRPLLLVGCAMFAGGGMFIELYFSHDYLELANRSYPMFPICFIIAALLSVCVMAASRWISIGKDTRFKKVLSTLGKESLLLFSIHYLDSLWSFAWKVECFGEGASQLISSILRLVLDIIIFYITLSLRQRFCASKT